MKKSRFTEAQMVAILRETDKGTVAETAKKHGVSEQTIYTWRKRFGAMDANEVKRLRTLEQENARLKKILAERDLEVEVMKEIAVKNGERTRPPATGGLRDGPRAVGSPGVCAALRSPFRASLRIADGQQG